MGFSRSVRAPARTLALCTADHDERTNGDSDGNGEERAAGSAAGSSSDTGGGEGTGGRRTRRRKSAGAKRRVERASRADRAAVHPEPRDIQSP